VTQTHAELCVVKREANSLDDLGVDGIIMYKLLLSKYYRRVLE